MSSLFWAKLRYYYGARWYDPALGRFIQPDTLFPDAADARSYDHYAYALNNPLKYNDPSGHYPCATGVCVGPSELSQAVQAAQDAARAAGPYAGPVFVGTAAVGLIVVGGTPVVNWAIQDNGPDYSVQTGYEAGALQTSARS